MVYIGAIAPTVFLAFLYQLSGGCGPRRLTGAGGRTGAPRIRARGPGHGVLFILMVLPAILVSGLRYGISVDYVGIYEKGFYRIAGGSAQKSGFEAGFRALVRLCASVIAQPWGMFLCVAAITVVLFFCALRDSSDSFVLSVILFFATGLYFDTFNGIRQYIAVAAFVYSFRYIREQRPLRYAAVLLIAGLFHKSAFFLIPLYALRRVNLSGRKWIVAFAVALVLSTQITNLFLFVASKVQKYNEYILRGALAVNTSFSLSGLVTALIAGVPCFVNGERMRETQDGVFLFNIVMCGITVSLISGALPLAMRVLYYCNGMYLLSVPRAIALSGTRRQRQLLSYGVVILLAGMTVIGMNALGWYAVLPYRSIFSR